MKGGLKIGFYNKNYLVQQIKSFPYRGRFRGGWI